MERGLLLQVVHGAGEGGLIVFGERVESSDLVVCLPLERGAEDGHTISDLQASQRG